MIYDEFVKGMNWNKHDVERHRDNVAIEDVESFVDNLTICNCLEDVLERHEDITGEKIDRHGYINYLMGLSDNEELIGGDRYYFKGNIVSIIL